MSEQLSWRLEGVSAAEAALVGFGERIRLVAPVAVEAGAEVVERSVVKALGRLSHSKGSATPSAPGQPPAKVTGHLQGSVHLVKATESGFGNYKAGVGVDADYALVQEFGGRAGRGGAVVLPERPYVRPSIEPRTAEIGAALSEAFAAALRA